MTTPDLEQQTCRCCVYTNEGSLKATCYKQEETTKILALVQFHRLKDVEQ